MLRNQLLSRLINVNQAAETLLGYLVLVFRENYRSVLLERVYEGRNPISILGVAITYVDLRVHGGGNPITYSRILSDRVSKSNRMETPVTLKLSGFLLWEYNNSRTDL